MTTDELNAIVKAVMDELEKAGVDFDFKAETPQPTDLVYVMRGTADKYQGITVKWQNLLDIIVKKATDAKDEAVSAKDLALQTLATIQGIESNVSLMKSSVETTKGEVETLKSDVSAMKASVETSEANVTQMKSDVSEMKTSVEGTKTEVEGLKSDVTNLKAQTQNIVDNAEEQVTGLLDTKADATYVDGELAKKVNYSDSLTYEEIMATNPVPDLTNKVASANAVQTLGNNKENWKLLTSILFENTVSEFETQFQAGANYKVVTLEVASGVEGGGIMFRHNTNKSAYGIVFSEYDGFGAKIVKRDVDATWYYRDIL